MRGDARTIETRAARRKTREPLSAVSLAAERMTGAANRHAGQIDAAVLATQVSKHWPAVQERGRLGERPPFADALGRYAQWVKSDIDARLSGFDEFAVERPAGGAAA